MRKINVSGEHEGGKGSLRLPAIEWMTQVCIGPSDARRTMHEACMNVRRGRRCSLEGLVSG